MKEYGEELIRIEDMAKVYDTGALKVLGLKRINLTIRRGEFVAIMGQSGSGKSTLMNILGCLDRPSLGHYYLDGADVAGMTSDELSAIRNKKIGFVFQSYNLLPILTVYENIVLPLELDGRKPDQAFVEELLTVLGMKEKRDSLPGQLSGGQQQRAAIARALAAKPAIVLADEPTGNLDSRNSQEVLGLLKTTGKQFHQTILMITHNEELAQLCDCIIHIEDGRIISQSWEDTK